MIHKVFQKTCFYTNLYKYHKQKLNNTSPCPPTAKKAKTGPPKSPIQFWVNGVVSCKVAGDLEIKDEK